MAPAVYSRENPSPRYRDLLAYYRSLHDEGDPEAGIAAEHMFDGRSLPPQGMKIADLVRDTGSRTLLDYGSGKGRQYGPLDIEGPDGRHYTSIAEFWGVEPVVCYDPAYAPFSERPDGQFDGVICTDVMEHCPEEDLPWIVGEIFGYAEKFVFLSVALYPAVKTLPNGENAHCTLRPKQWWLDLFADAARFRPGVPYFVCFIEMQQRPDGTSERAESLFRGKR